MDFAFVLLWSSWNRRFVDRGPTLNLLLGRPWVDPVSGSLRSSDSFLLLRCSVSTGADENETGWCLPDVYGLVPDPLVGAKQTRDWKANALAEYRPRQALVGTRANARSHEIRRKRAPHVDANGRFFASFAVQMDGSRTRSLLSYPQPLAARRGSLFTGQSLLNASWTLHRTIASSATHRQLCFPSSTA